MLPLPCVSFCVTSCQSGTPACVSNTTSVDGPFSLRIKPQSKILQKDMQLLARLCRIIFKLFFVAVLVLWVVIKSFSNSCCHPCLPQGCQNLLAHLSRSVNPETTAHEIKLFQKSSSETCLFCLSQVLLRRRYCLNPKVISWLSVYLPFNTETEHCSAVLYSVLKVGIFKNWNSSGKDISELGELLGPPNPTNLLLSDK